MIGLLKSIFFLYSMTMVSQRGGFSVIFYGVVAYIMRSKRLWFRVTCA